MSLAVERFQSHFEQLEATARAGEPGWLRGARKQGFARFRELGLPTRRLEDWKYTSVARVASTDYRPADSQPASPSRDAIEERAVPVFACSLFVFVNGRLSGQLSSPPALSGGVRVDGLARTLRESPEHVEHQLGHIASPDGHAFTALNTALFQDGAFVHLSQGQQAPAPIHLVFVTSPGAGPLAAHPRVLIVAEEGSRATVIEDYVSDGGGTALCNAVTEVVVGENAGLDLVRIQREGPGFSHLSRLAVRQARASRFASHSLSLSGDLVRNDIDLQLADEAADCSLYGLFVIGDGEHADNHTLIDHAKPHCRSRELYKGILAGRARGVFDGRIVVRPDSQHSNAWQKNQNLLLSDDARIHTKPQLEILADDVGCSHGSTVGQLEDEALFYLRARGIDEHSARVLLTRAFAAEILDALPVAPLRERVGEFLTARFVGVPRGTG